VTTTQRNDWLTEGLATLPDVFVSGSATFSRRLGSKGLLTLRLFGHHPAGETPPGGEERKTWLPSHYTIPFAALTCELPDQASVDSASLEIEKKIRNEWSARLKIPLYLIAYSAENWDLGKQFNVVGPDGTESLRTPTEFARELNRLRSGRPEDEPEELKAVHKSVNDVFQVFTRNRLSRQFSINDVDVLLMLPHGVAFLELKRSSKTPWKPYVDDAPNYLLMRSLTRAVFNGVDFTLHYEPNKPTQVDVHTILDVTRTVIPGFYKAIVGPDAASTIRATLAFLCDPTIYVYTSGNARIGAR
jgi:hypothetical protein